MVAPLPSPRSELELTADQLRGIDAYTRAARAAEAASAAAASAELSREMRLDLSRRLEARRREQKALLARAARHLEDSARALWTSRPRAVVVHRNAWLRTALSDRLASSGVEVLAALDNGADGAGVVVAEQPEVLLVEDRLPSLSGLEVLERAREFSPRTLVAAHLAGTAELDAFLQRGARAVFTRRLPPAVMADELVGCLRSGGDLVALR